MRYTPPLNSVDPDDPYVDMDASIGVEGSDVPAAAIEGPQREIHNAINILLGTVEDPDVASSDDFTQLAQAILAAVAAGIPEFKSSGHGECRLTLSSSNLVLESFNGNKININETVEEIPPNGITLPDTNLLEDTIYYIYAYMDGDPASMKLEASTTGHATHTNGVEIKNGDSTRTLVGMARTNASANWVDSDTQVFVLSYFNRIKKIGASSLSANRSTSSNTLVEIDPEIRVEFLTWGDFKGFSNGLTNSSGAYIHSYQISIDGDLHDKWRCMRQAATGTNKSESFAYRSSLENEGYHYSSLFVSTNAGTMTLYGGATDTQNKKVYQHIEVRG